VRRLGMTTNGRRGDAASEHAHQVDRSGPLSTPKSHEKLSQGVTKAAGGTADSAKRQVRRITRQDLIAGVTNSVGISKSTPNRDGTYPDTNRDFMDQGVGNVAAGLFGGMPIGGSVSSTALVVQMGGRSRIVNFIVGPIIAIVVLFLSGAIEQIPLTTLAAILVVVGVRAIEASHSLRF
jgi:hypothetical protein